MTKQTEAMKLALEALEESKTNNDTMEFHDRKNKAITALQALAEQPAQQEPEWYHFVRYGEDCFVPYSGQAPEKATPLYTSPQRTWVGLTDEEIEKIWNSGVRAFFLLARAIEAKLKEKNA